MASSDLQNSTKLASMDVERVLHMKEGLGEASYAQNSSLQKKSMDTLKHIVIQSAVDLYASQTPQTLMLADLGCSSGPNTLSMTEGIVKAIERRCHEASLKLPNFMVFLNDLPANDFNTVFKVVPEFIKKLKMGCAGVGGPSVYVAGIPGSFYGRLFPNSSLHFISSWYSLHWLSQVPSGLFDEEGNPMNKGKIYISQTSPLAVITSYSNQFQKDFNLFLKSRAEEIIHGGRMALAMLGRKSQDHYDRSTAFLWDMLAQSLAAMVSKGLVTEEKVDSYNVPFYASSPNEIKDEVQKEGSFAIDHIQVYELNTSPGDASKASVTTSMAIRAIHEPMISHHFGGGIVEPLFEHYTVLLSEAMAKEEVKGAHLLVVLRKL